MTRCRIGIFVYSIWFLAAASNVDVFIGEDHMFHKIRALLELIKGFLWFPYECEVHKSLLFDKETKSLKYYEHKQIVLLLIWV